ncbi:MAG: hypothetical protein E7616_07945 [Ruminococcaceae bacterium]|nr:hypothetical protein [Oscillospiraceae bacterium]
MILDQKKTTIAYRCPHCTQSVFSIIGVFTLSGDLIRLKCPCEGSDLTIAYTADKKIRLTVPCLVCPKPHTYTISPGAFFDRDLLTLPCAYTGLDIAFIGTREKVGKAIEETGDQLLKMLKEAGYTDLASLRRQNEDAEDDFLTDPQVEDIVRFMLCELDDEGKIDCYCKEDGEIPYYNFQILSERVRVFCECCNAEATLPLAGPADAAGFLNIDEIHLK